MDIREWRRSIKGQDYLISTARNLPHDFIQNAFNTKSMYWANPIPAASMKTLLENSCTLGLYKFEDGTHTPIGMARIITDYATFAYLTDVYLMDEYRGLGLGKWIIHCCREIVLDIPDLRFMMLSAGSEQARQLYKRELAMKIMGPEEMRVVMRTEKAKLQEVAAGSTALSAASEV